MRVIFYSVLFLISCCFSSISSAQEKTKVILATGTAFSITKNGFLLTSAHILNEKDKIEVIIPGKNVLIPAKLIALDRTADIALLKISSDTIPLPIVDWANVNSGLDIVALGYPNPQSLAKA
jgi:S1-C subfamily serine protease